MKERIKKKLLSTLCNQLTTLLVYSLEEVSPNAAQEDPDIDRVEPSKIDKAVWDTPADRNQNNTYDSTINDTDIISNNKSNRDFLVWWLAHPSA